MPEDTDLPQATVVRRSHTRISVVWIIPILAAAVALGIAVQRILSEGPTITIVFKAAEGLEAGKTLVKHKDVTIGTVTAVRLSVAARPDGLSRPPPGIADPRQGGGQTLTAGRRKEGSTRSAPLTVARLRA